MRFKDKPRFLYIISLHLSEIANYFVIITERLFMITTIKHGRETDTTKWTRPLSWIHLIDVHQNLVFEVAKNRWRARVTDNRCKRRCGEEEEERHSAQQLRQNGIGKEKSMQMPTSRQRKRSTSIAWQRRQKKPLAVETWSSCIISPGLAVNMEDRKDQLRTKMGRPSLEKKGNSMGGRSTSRNFWTDLAYSTYPPDI